MYYLGVDIGGTSVKMGIVDDNGNIYDKAQYEVAFDGYVTPIIQTVKTKVKEYLTNSSYEVIGIGISATGQIDSVKGEVIGTAGHIPNYIGSKFKEEIHNDTKLPVTVTNDANCMLLGEIWKGNASNYKNVVGITLGTGVGGGVMVDGNILLGNRGIAGELGHMILNNDGIKCYCGNIGCYEQYASTTALIKLCETELKVSDLNGSKIFEMAKDNNESIIKCMDIWLNNIADGLISLIHIFNPDYILIGGGVSAQKELLMSPIEEIIRKKAMPRFSENLVIEAATLGNDAGIIGAIYFYFHVILSSRFCVYTTLNPSTSFENCDSISSFLSIIQITSNVSFGLSFLNFSII